MYRLLVALTAIALLGGCSHHHKPLEIGKKKKLVSELIASASACDPFRDKLASPAIDDDAVDDVFHEALHAHCVKKDI